MKDDKVFAQLRTEQPIAGDVLSTATGSPVRISVKSIQDPLRGEHKIVFCRAKIDTNLKRWVLHDGEAGVVCMVLPNSQTYLKKDSTGGLEAVSLKVVRYTSTRRALLCEVVS